MSRGLPSLLPASHGRFGRQSQFQENQFPSGSQDAPHSLQCGKNVRDRPKCKCRYDKVHARILQRDLFPWQLQILDVQIFRTLRLCERDHPRIWFQCVEFCNPRGIVIRKIRSCTRPYFKDDSARPRDNSMAKVANWFGITHPADEIGIDAVTVKRHDSPVNVRRSNGLKRDLQTPDRYTSSGAAREDSWFSILVS